MFRCGDTIKKAFLTMLFLFSFFVFVSNTKADTLINTGSLINDTPSATYRLAFNANNKAYIYIDSSNIETLGTTTVHITTNGIISNANWTLSECYTNQILATTTVNYPNYSLASSTQVFYFNLDVSDYDCLHLWVTTTDSDVAGILNIPSTTSYATSTYPLWQQENFKFISSSYTDLGLVSPAVPYIKVEGDWKNPIDCSEETGQCINQENVSCTDIFGCIEDTFECETCRDCLMIGQTCSYEHEQDDITKITSCKEIYTTSTDEVIGTEYTFYHIPLIAFLFLAFIISVFYFRFIKEILIRLRR